MQFIQLGRTGLSITRTGFGALPIQRLSHADAVDLVRAAHSAGITYFDTARAYTDSEAKLGTAFKGRWTSLTIATKTGAQNADGFWRDLETSVNALGVECIDVYQFHNPPFVPKPGAADGLYDAALLAQRQGKIRHIGITQHSIDLAFEAVESGLYATLQYPFNHLASRRDLELVELCREKNVGFIAMKALSGGLITDAQTAFSYIHQFENVVPIWGIQRPSELQQIIALSQNPPQIDDEILEKIERDRNQLVGSFCRSCGYCLPCPVGIPIHNANRMTQLLTRSPAAQWFTPEWQEGMEKIEDCIHCGVCATRCPYGLKPYETMPAHLQFYREALSKFEQR